MTLAEEIAYVIVLCIIACGKPAHEGLCRASMGITYVMRNCFDNLIDTNKTHRMNRKRLQETLLSGPIKDYLLVLCQNMDSSSILLIMKTQCCHIKLPSMALLVHPKKKKKGISKIISNLPLRYHHNFSGDDPHFNGELPWINTLKLIVVGLNHGPVGHLRF